VCWAAPVRDAVTGRQLGVIDLSTTWDRTHPIGLATARMMARLLEDALPPVGVPVALRSEVGHSSDTGLVLRLLGRVEVALDGQRLLLTRRQNEILALLALRPEGLTLEQLHAQVYGELSVTLSTLKAEVSHLCSALGGRLTSRPYRLMMPVDTDVDAVLHRLRAGNLAAAVESFRRRAVARHDLPGARRARRLRRRGGPRGAARRPPARSGALLQLAGAVRHGGGLGRARRAARAAPGSSVAQRPVGRGRPLRIRSPARVAAHPQGRSEGSTLGYRSVAAILGARYTERGSAVMEIIGVIVAGIIIGLLGKFVAPGDKDNIPIWLTILCGIGGVILGWLIYAAFGGTGNTSGVDWVRWIVAIAVAAVLVVIASTLTGRNSRRHV
jgi:uncharacterized membrane protein YeaQ/YmgE (transglycosylase-associated protein family)